MRKHISPRLNNGTLGEGVLLTEDQNPLRMRYVSPNVAAKDEIGQDALDLVQIDRHAKPLEGLGHILQMDLRLAQNHLHHLNIATASCKTEWPHPTAPNLRRLSRIGTMIDELLSQLDVPTVSSKHNGI